ncbi:25580_t:CDS:1 [Dentiscutata erythropus]|uniref:25580_t:CDS:1 n=1 Tax=Dentiscutata erythropus TaxID=1348616 RepID=A0A9N9AHW8_9GLOM|nr:25580_t:CDS:1 [Dentiscutata erythropus]
MSISLENEPFEKGFDFIQDHHQLSIQEKEYIIDELCKIRNVNVKKTPLDSLCIYCQSIVYKEVCCTECIRLYLIDNFTRWTSGNTKIDEMIRFFQLKYCEQPNKLIEWVPYENFQSVELKAEGGFGIVHIANWKDGTIVDWNEDDQTFIRSGKRQSL